MSSHEGAPPYGGYAAIVGTFFTGLGAVAGLAKRAPTASALDLVALSAATFKASRAVSRERVGSFLRQPLVEGAAEDGAYERLRERGCNGPSASSSCARGASAPGLRPPWARPSFSHPGSGVCSRGRSAPQRRTISCKRASWPCAPR